MLCPEKENIYWPRVHQQREKFSCNLFSVLCGSYAVVAVLLPQRNESERPNKFPIIIIKLSIQSDHLTRRIYHFEPPEGSSRAPVDAFAHPG